MFARTVLAIFVGVAAMTTSAGEPRLCDKMAKDHNTHRSATRLTPDRKSGV
jgi:hypothetical protein